MDLVEKFQELTGITQRETAEEILQQFDWNIESAVDFFLVDGKPGDSSQVDAGSSPHNSALDSPHSPHSRLLNFEITLYLDDRKREVAIISLEDIRDSITLGDFKRCLVDKHRDSFVKAAENSGLPSDSAALLVALRFDGTHNQNSLNDHVTLRSLHLPLNNSWTARLVRRHRVRPNTEVAGRENASFPTTLDVRVRLIESSHQRDGATNTRSVDSRVIRLRNISETTSLFGLKRSAAKESGISVSNQVWSLPESETSSSLEAMVRDLNMSSNASSEHKLQRYNLRHDNFYILELTNSQAPSTSHSSFSSTGVATSEDNCRPQRSKKKIHYDLSQELDDDGGFTIYSDIDDANDGMVFVSDSTNPYSLPLIPLSLIESPQEALENFYHVFIQRYCSNPEECIPPFLLCPFNEALSQCFSTSRVADRKPLFIYLHHDHSVAAHIFCNRLLCSQQMSQFMEANQLKIWPWDVTLDGARTNVLHWMQPRLEYLATEIIQTQTDQFPLLIMLCKLGGSYEAITILTGHGFTTPVSSHSWSSVDDHSHSMEAFPPLESVSASPTTAPAPLSHTQGKLDAEDVVSELWQKYVMYQERLQPEVQADSQRAEREMMREEQDRAYKESLEQDRLKVEAKQREEAEAAQREEEARIQAEAAQREARNRQIASGRALPPEPLVGTVGVATLRFRLPTTLPSPPSYEHLSDAEKQPIQNGMITRRFRARDTLRDLKNYMESLGYAVADFKLLTTFPRVDLTANLSDDVTLAELKLVPQETLNLEQR
ncbi:FAS-associated factor 1 [Echinococcus granulosus]|uniref:FAS associated factor 1 n=1 Tax=Echinococcus granulosus TaxID=6210 RepID=A0A068WSB3_ECHGR|nr:FAS-associated factor 1 [Echinococcus granulosus]CDS21336.1 FAS associated factor 1 [Echinococcus granulosus]